VSAVLSWIFGHCMYTSNIYSTVSGCNFKNNRLNSLGVMTHENLETL